MLSRGAGGRENSLKSKRGSPEKKFGNHWFKGHVALGCHQVRLLTLVIETRTFQLGVNCIIMFNISINENILKKRVIILMKLSCLGFHVVPTCSV